MYNGIALYQHINVSTSFVTTEFAIRKALVHRNVSACRMIGASRAPASFKYTRRPAILLENVPELPLVIFGILSVSNHYQRCLHGGGVGALPLAQIYKEEFLKNRWTIFLNQRKWIKALLYCEHYQPGIAGKSIACAVRTFPTMYRRIGCILSSSRLTSLLT